MSAPKTDSSSHLSSGGVNILSPPKAFRSLNGVRAICTIWIVIFHAMWSMFHFISEADIDRLVDSPGLLVIKDGLNAVDVFFVLTGFLLAIPIFTEPEDKKISWRSFVYRRLIRIYPLYLICLFLYCFMIHPNGQYPLHQMGTPGVMEMLKESKQKNNETWLGDDVEMAPTSCELSWVNVLGLNNFVPFGGCMGWTWSLAIQIQFYLLFPLLIKILGKGKNLLRFCYFSITVGLILRYLTYEPLNGPGRESKLYLIQGQDIVPFALRFYFYSLSFNRLHTMFWGVVLAYVVYKKQQWVLYIQQHGLLRKLLLLLSITVFVVNFYPHDIDRNIHLGVLFNAGGTLHSFAICFLLLITMMKLGVEGRLLSNLFENAVWDWISIRNYPIYLMHMVLIVVAYSRWFYPIKADLWTYWTQYVPFALLSSVVVGYILDIVDTKIYRCLAPKSARPSVRAMMTTTIQQQEQQREQQPLKQE